MLDEDSLYDFMVETVNDAVVDFVPTDDLGKRQQQIDMNLIASGMSLMVRKIIDHYNIKGLGKKVTDEIARSQTDDYFRGQ